MNGRPLQLALREMQALLTSPAQLVGMAVAAAALTLSGPFGTYTQLSAGPRLLLWASTVLLAYTTGQGAVTLAIETLRPWIRQKWPRVVVASLLAAVPVTLVVLAINLVVAGNFDAGGVLRVWLNVTAITLALVVLMVLVTDRMRAAAEAQVPLAASTPDAPPPILQRVPPPQRGKLLALSVEDHYVNIITDRGKTLVLMRLADAIREAGTIEGVQIHRSHWVAHAAVRRSLRSEGRLLVELTDGRQLPVSRGFAPAAKAAGLV